MSHDEIQQKAKQAIAIWEAIENNWDFARTRKAAELSGFTSFDSARPQSWSDEMRKQGNGDLINGVVWDYTTNKFGAPVNLHAELYRQLSALMQEHEIKVLLCLHIGEYCTRYNLEQYAKENNLSLTV